jgi:hypothetical protein
VIHTPPTHYRCAFLSSRSVFRLASLFYKPLVILSLAVGAFGLLGPAAIAQNVINCSSFSTSGACGISFEGSSNNQAFFSAEAGGSVTGGAIDFVPAGATHNGASMWYQKRVNVQAFSTTFTFVPNGYNFAFVLQNVTNQGNPFTDGFGAGGEGGFSQFAGGSNIAPNNIWALSFDSGGFNTQTQSSYSNGGVQIYQTLQVPALPLGAEAGYLPWYPTNKVSISSPFSFTSGKQYTPTGHTYGATITYDGNNVTLNMWDVTAGGSCPGTSCFTHTWQGVYIPAVTGGTTAVVGFTSGIGLTTTDPLYLRSFSYTADSPSALSDTAAWNANAVTNDGTASAASPVYSVAPGTYAGTTNVAISTSTEGAYICYTLSSSTPALTPQPNNNGGCSAGTLYSGPISISSSATLYAMAGTSDAAHPSTLGPPSSLTAAAYTIEGGSSSSGSSTSGSSTSEFSISPPAPSTWTSGCDPSFGTLQANGLCTANIVITGNFPGLTCAQTQSTNSTTVYTQCSYKPLP